MTESEAHNLKTHAQTILSIAKGVDPTSVLRGIHKTGNHGAEVLVGNESGVVQSIKQAFASHLPLSTVTIKQDVLNGGHEVVVALDKSEERIFASRRVKSMILPRLMRFTGVAVMALAVATQALSNHRAAAIAPAVFNLINATLGNSSAVVFQQALEAARETLGHT